VIVAVFALAGLDPYIGLASTMIGLGTLGIVALQAMAAFAVVAFFRRRDDGHWFGQAVAPTLGGIGLAVAVALTAFNFRVLTNSSSWLLNALPMVYLVAAVGGVGYATWLRNHRRAVFDGIAESTFRQILVGTPEPAPSPFEPFAEPERGRHFDDE
jgi:hypothetical protein